MKQSIPLFLAFVLALMLGIIADWCCYDVIVYAREISGGKPLPPLTEWLFNHLGRWHNGSVLAIFLIPWGAWMVVSLWVRRAPSSQASALRFSYGFACWALVEAILFGFFLFFSLLPLLPHYITAIGEECPMGAYVPHWILGTMALAALGISIARFRK
jgi:hypothetical protein